MPRRIITEEELREAAREVLEYELAIFDSYSDYPDHIFHGKFRLNMAALLHEVKRGAIEAAKYSMGFTFYAKQCIAAVLILFTLSCIAMPETVLAGYHKLIEVIETVFEEYTEYRYRVNDDGGIEETFKPLKLGYLPEGMEEVDERRNKDTYILVYKNMEGQYLRISQKQISSKNNIVYNIDNEILGHEVLILTNGKVVQIDIKDQRIVFTWKYDSYFIMGQTDLTKQQLVEILNRIKL